MVRVNSAKAARLPNTPAPLRPPFHRLPASRACLRFSISYIPLRLLPEMETAFRKIDIDQYDEDVLLDSELYEPDPREPAQVLEEAKQKSGSVRSFLSKYVLGNPYEQA
jgi:hypothetical protein